MHRTWNAQYYRNVNEICHRQSSLKVIIFDLFDVIRPSKSDVRWKKIVKLAVVSVELSTEASLFFAEWIFKKFTQIVFIRSNINEIFHFFLCLCVSFFINVFVIMNRHAVWFMLFEKKAVKLNQRTPETKPSTISLHTLHLTRKWQDSELLFETSTAIHLIWRGLWK